MKPVATTRPKTAQPTKLGTVPNYLLRLREKEEKERQDLLLQIELNKRPEGTIKLKREEVGEMRDILVAKKHELQCQLEKTSVANYTMRAKNQKRQLVDELNSVDRALTVFERDNVFIKK